MRSLLSKRWLWITLLFVAINVAGLIEIISLLAEPALAVESFTPLGEASRRGAIRIRFNELMVSQSQTRKPFTTRLVAFMPSLRGRFAWQDAQTLVFQPAQILATATPYLATVSADLSSLRGHSLRKDAHFSFHTPRLQLRHLRQMNLARDRRLSLALEFNDEVVASEVASHLTLLTESGKPLEYRLVSSPPLVVRPLPLTFRPEGARGVVCITTDPVHEPKIILRLAGGLRGKGGPLGITEDVERTFALEPAFVIESLRPCAPVDGDLSIEVPCTRRIDVKRVKDFIRIVPPVKFTARPYYYGFDINGPFKPSERYTLTFLKGLRAVGGAALERDIVRTVVFPDLPGAIRFRTRGVYLSSRGRRRLPIESVNIASLEVSVEEVYRNNLIHYIKQDSACAPPGDLGHTVAAKTFKVQAKRNHWHVLSLDLRELLGDDALGAYVVTVREAGRGWPRRRKLVLISDLGLTVKQSPRDLLVWVNSLALMQPAPGIEVSIFTRTNQKILTGVTNAGGMVHFKNLRRADDREPFVALAAGGNDLAVIEIADNALDISALDVAGRPYLRNGYEAFLHGDRGIYRPGETVHLHALVRSREPALPGAFPVRFRIKRPDGRDFRTLPATLTQWGSAAVSLPLPAYALTGRYTVALSLPQAAAKLGTHSFRVEEFIPDRLKVNLAAEDRRFRADEPIPFTVKATHLFGAPAAGRKVEARAVLRQTPFTHPDWEGYRFYDTAKGLSVAPLILGRGRLDADGKKAFPATLPPHLAPAGAMVLDCTATVREVGGRAVTVVVARNVDAYPRYVGLRRQGKTLPRRGHEAAFSCALVHPDGSPAARAVLQARILRYWWNTVLKYGDPSSGGRYRYVSEREEEVVATLPCPVARGKGRLAFVPRLAGHYEVRVKDPDGGASANLTFYCRGGGEVAPSMEKPDRLDLLTDRKSYAPGQTARVVIKAPFRGMVLFTIESDAILLARTLRMESNSCEVSFPVRAEFGPNVYCAATVLRRPNPGGAWAAQRAFGAVPLQIDASPARLAVTIGAPASVRPGQPLRVDLNVRDASGRGARCELTLAAVDEGVCALTGLDTPDPWAFFFGQRRLAVVTSDIYSRLMPEVDKKKAGSDSDAGGGAGPAYDPRRLNPISAKRVKPVALWRAGIETGDDGHATVSLDVPAEFNGRLRLTAVAAAAQCFGATSRGVLVTQPLMLRASLPRFLAPGDAFLVPVVVFNNTPVSGPAAVTLTGRGLQFLSPPDKVIPLDSGREGTVFFRLKAPKVPGVVSLKLTAALAGERASRTADIPVRPPAGLRTLYGSGSVEAGTTAAFLMPGGWLPETDTQRLAFSGRPALTLAGSLRYLLRYPYGCLEQTTSCCFPLLYLSDIAACARSESFTREEITVFVQAGIDRLMSMRTYRGAFAMWPGHTSPYEWGSVYATHFLMEAKQAGYIIPEGRLEAALDYLEALLQSGSCLSTKAYACYVLAHAGRSNASWAYRLYEQRERLAGYSRFHLAAAMALAREKELATALAHVGALPVAGGTRDMGGVLHSPMREAAILLSVMLDLDPDSPHVPALVRQLEGGMSNGRWATTQENSFALMALGKYARYAHKRPPDYRAKVTLEGKPLAAFTHADQVRKRLTGAGGRRVAVSVTGRGRLYYHWSADGIPASGEVTARDSGVSVRRQLLSRGGAPLNPEAIPHGEIVIVRIMVKNERRLENLVISDLLPAGFEIENPRIATREVIAHQDASRQRLIPERVEMRDDRLLLFADLRNAGACVYYYAARAVTAGRFRLPAIEASCMYNPAVSSVHGAGEVRIIHDH